MLTTRISVKDARLAPAIGSTGVVQGWVRTRRDSKGGFSFIEVNDGSSLGNLQVIADANLANYESEVKKLVAGCSVTIEGTIKASGGGKQPTEMGATKIVVHGWADPETYPLQKKQHTLEKLREWAHLRPRTNSIGAVTRVRNCVSRSIHNFYQEEGFLYIHTPIITASDCEGAGAMFRVTTLDLDKLALSGSKVRTELDFFGKPAYLTVSGQLNGEIFACALGKIYTFGPTFRAENSNTSRHLAEFWMVDPPLDRELEFLAARFEDFDRLGVRQAAELGGDDFFQRGDGRFVVVLVEQGHVLAALVQGVLEQPLEEPLGQVHVVGQLVEGDFGLDHPEFGEVPRGVAVLGAERRAKRINFS